MRLADATKARQGELAERQVPLHSSLRLPLHGDTTGVMHLICVQNCIQLHGHNLARADPVQAELRGIRRMNRPSR
eukprot:scaffold107874_cov28-Tisochrysis_lutea.AAC.2